jgi:SAM-dependent methyltransferase
MNDRAAFDQYADEYDASLAAALELSGEDRMFYAQGRVKFFAACARKLGFAAGRALDFGCGVGSTAPLLCVAFNLAHYTGVDVSPRSIQLAREREKSDRCDFFLLSGKHLLTSEYKPDASMDLAYCNGVFHHIPIEQRIDAARYVHDSLRPGGLFALWENFAWNPGTRYVMSHCAFDTDAITLVPRQARQLLHSAGFEILRTDFAFVFPRFLKALRPLEKLLVKFPMGAQYQVLARKPK